jgi:hypothetical protein
VSPSILIANIADTDTVGLVGRDLAEALVVMSESEDNDPRLIDRVALEYIERIHDSDPDVVCLVRECEALGRFSKFLRRRFIARLSDGDQFRIGVCTLKRLRRSGALARVLARQELQITPRVLIRRMPEKGRRPAGRALANTIDFIAGGAQERECLWLWRPCAAFWTPRIRGFGHSWSLKPSG